MDLGSRAMPLAIDATVGGSAVLAERLLNFVLFIAVASSSIVFIEPAPHDLVMFVLLVACVAARLPLDRKLVPLLLLLGTWLVGGLLSLAQVGDQPKAIAYMGISAYLATAGAMFACLFSDANPARLSILRRAYIVAALIATAAGFIGFFRLLPGWQMFLLNDRVSATFKDPNVFGPFLIFPLLLLIISLFSRGVRLLQLATVIALLGGLFMSFSRGAWMHFVVSAFVATAMLFVVTPEPRMRMRIVSLSIASIVVVSLVVLALLSIESVRDVFLIRAQLLQSYDVGPGGRFGLQELALDAILEHPNGMGPEAFSLAYGGQQHDVYMEGFLVYGWLGGAAYLTLIVVTLLLGLRCASKCKPTAWQPYLIAAFATYVGEIGEGTIIDSDHWRHFFLVVGMVWGLSIATLNDQRRQFAATNARPG